MEVRLQRRFLVQRRHNKFRNRARLYFSHTSSISYGLFRSSKQRSNYHPQFIQPEDEKSFEPKKVAEIQLSDNKAWEKMEQALVDVISARNGTAHKVFDANSVVIAGKTGTAQIKSILPGKEYDAIRENPALRDHALFVGYGPVKDPKLVVAVIIENGESGSEVAAPIVKSAINFYTGGLDEE